MIVPSFLHILQHSTAAPARFTYQLPVARLMSNLQSVWACMFVCVPQLQLFTTALLQPFGDISWLPAHTHIAIYVLKHPLCTGVTRTDIAWCRTECVYQWFFFLSFFNSSFEMKKMSLQLVWHPQWQALHKISKYYVDVGESFPKLSLVLMTLWLNDLLIKTHPSFFLITAGC